GGARLAGEAGEGEEWQERLLPERRSARVRDEAGNRQVPGLVQNEAVRAEPAVVQVAVCWATHRLFRSRDEGARAVRVVQVAGSRVPRRRRAQGRAVGRREGQRAGRLWLGRSAAGAQGRG